MITIEHGSMMAQIDSRGCHVNRVQFKGNDVIKPTGDGHMTHGGCAPLIPYANRIEYGTYEWNGKEYNFPKDRDGNSIHGYAKELIWNVEERDTDSVTMTQNLSNESYPFDVDVQIHICVDENRFCELATFTNRGEVSAPLSPGFHPYFLTGSNWEVYLHRRPLKSLKKDKYFPSGNYSEYYRHFGKSDVHTYDDCFKYEGNIQIKGDYFTYVLETTNSGYFMVYDGKYSDGRSVAVEPMKSEVNAFRTGTGLKELLPNEVWPFGYSFTVNSL